MHWKALLLAIVPLGVAPLSGCLLARNAARNVVNEPAELRDDHKLRRQLRRDAEAAWAEVRVREPQGRDSADFAAGFVDGYVDYLDAGGSAEPPAVPPLRYRRSRYMTAEGHALVREYFCGFRRGGEAAVASGRRDLITVPILLAEPRVDPPVQARRIPGEGRAPPRPPEILPAPRPAGRDASLPLLDRPLSPPVLSAAEEVPRITILDASTPAAPAVAPIAIPTAPPSGLVPVAPAVAPIAIPTAPPSGLVPVAPPGAPVAIPKAPPAAPAVAPIAIPTAPPSGLVPVAPIAIPMAPPSGLVPMVPPVAPPVAPIAIPVAPPVAPIAIPTAPPSGLVPLVPPSGLVPLGNAPNEIPPMPPRPSELPAGLRAPLRELPNRTVMPYVASPEDAPLPPRRGD